MDLEHKIQVVNEGTLDLVNKAHDLCSCVLGHAPEYTQPLKELDASLKARLEIAG